ncbi:MGMT family protein [Halobacterium sp. CBA1126]|uniref:MGMT family protein n=1 Tax=Halobacterium sp. CBA1126 TaxID=2668074 RepID=UPI0012FA07CD|nr:MGMT family protein [Halobacterium sp. CBA1126]MUV60545.1 methylated-DNA--[protein]-cysteine S-methyltransferase [Halobacterium sp. CBA1126]
MTAAGIYARDSAYLDRAVQLGVAGDRVISVSFPGTAPADADPEHELLDRLDDYFAGAEDDFDDVEVGLTVPTNHRRVLEAVRNVPYGERVTVKRVLSMVPDVDPEDSDARETAREALAENPVPLFVPDHRVRDGPSGAPPEVVDRLRDLEA